VGPRPTASPRLSKKEIYEKLSTVGDAATKGKPDLAAFYSK
jgi:hypothetical protein